MATRSVQDKGEKHREEMDQDVQEVSVGDEQIRLLDDGVRGEEAGAEARAQDEGTPDEAVEEKAVEEKRVGESFLPVLQSKRGSFSGKASEKEFARVYVPSAENSEVAMKRPRSYEEQVNKDVSRPQNKRRSTVHVPTETPSLQLSLELFEIHNNGTKDYTIQQLNNETPSWKALRSLRCFVWGTETYSINDDVQILLNGVQGGAMARILQIRDFSDDLKLICVSWYYSRAELQNLIGEDAEPWPQDSSHVMSTHMQVLMSDAIGGKVHQRQLNMLARGKVIDICSRPCRIHNEDDTAVGWLLEL